MKTRLISCHQIIKRLLLLSLLISFLINLASVQTADENLTTIILVRHAEKVDDSSDPDLSEAGYDRADRLAEMFENVPFDAVYSTNFKRTRQTATPIANANNLNVRVYDHRNPQAEAKNWIENHKGETILISGHSNSTPTFANAVLGEEHFGEKFDESDYGNILVITILDDGEKKLLHMRY